jgi:hypothetical protein
LANGNPVKQIEKLVENQDLGSQLTSSMEDLSVGKLLRTHNIASFISKSFVNSSMFPQVPISVVPTCSPFRHPHHAVVSSYVSSRIQIWKLLLFFLHSVGCHN